MLLNDRLGRKLSIMFSALPSAVGYALMAGAQGTGMLLLGRVLTGYAGGVTSASIPVTCHWRELAGGLNGRRWGCSCAWDIPLLSAGMSRAPALWLVTGAGEDALESPMVLDFLACRKGKTSAQPCPVPPSSGSLSIYQTLSSCPMQRGRRALSNPVERPSSNGSLSVLLEHFSRAGRGRKLVVAARLLVLDRSGSHP